MKKQIGKTPYSREFATQLFMEIESMMDRDLSYPQAEREARALLARIRRAGYRPIPMDLEDPDCLMCLFTALQSAGDELTGRAPTVQSVEFGDNLLH